MENQADGSPPVANVIGNPILGRGLARRFSKRPLAVERIGNPLKNAQDRDRVGLSDPAAVLLKTDIQWVMSFIFNSPALPFQSQPLLRSEPLGARTHQPRIVELGTLPDLAIDPRQLDRARQSQLRRLKGARHDRPVFRPPPMALLLHHLRGEGPRAVMFERYGATSFDCPSE